MLSNQHDKQVAVHEELEKQRVIRAQLKGVFEEIDLDGSGEISMEDVIILADVVLALLAKEESMDSTALSDQIKAAFQSCISDAERLLLLDMTALESGPQSQLFVDDGRFRTTSVRAMRSPIPC